MLSGRFRLPTLPTHHPSPAMSQPPEYRHFAHRNPPTPPSDEPTARIPSLRSSIGRVGGPLASRARRRGRARRRCIEGNEARSCAHHADVRRRVGVVVTDAQSEEESVGDLSDRSTRQHDVSGVERGGTKLPVGVAPPVGEADHHVANPGDGPDELDASAGSDAYGSGSVDGVLEAAIARTPDAGRSAKLVDDRRRRPVAASTARPRRSRRPPRAQPTGRRHTASEDGSCERDVRLQAWAPLTNLRRRRSRTTGRTSAEGDVGDATPDVLSRRRRPTVASAGAARTWCGSGTRGSR